MMFIGVINLHHDFIIDVTAAKAIYVPGNYISIQLAIDNANPGDTIYVWDGTNYENVNLNKQVTLIGNGTINTTIDGGGTGDVVRITADGVNVSGFTLTNSGNILVPNYDAGIKLYEVQNVVISYNNCSGNTCGISLLNSDSNTIIDNNCSSNSKFGIVLRNSIMNKVSNNNCNNNGNAGIDLKYSESNIVENNNCSYNYWFGINVWEESNSNTIANNSCFSNWEGILIDKSAGNLVINNSCVQNYIGITLRYSKSNIITNNKLISSSIYIIGDKVEYWNTHSIDTFNTINNKPIHYWKNQTSGIIPVGAGQIILANCTNVRVENQTITNSWIPFTLAFSNMNYIKNNDISRNNGSAINLYFSDSNLLSNNTYNQNEYNGFCVTNSNHNLFKGNNASENDWFGIFLNHSSSSIIENNHFISNKWMGLRFRNSNKNKIYYNMIINNNIQAIEMDYSKNQWDNGKGEGNYWSDYKGLDNGANGE